MSEGNSDSGSDLIFKIGCPALLLGAIFLIAGCASINPANDRVEGPYAPGNSGPQLTYPSGNSGQQDPESKEAKDCLKEYIKSFAPKSPLIDKVDVFVAAGKKYNVNPALMLAIAQQESSFGTTGVATNGGFNYYGITACSGGFRAFSSWDEAINFQANYLKTEYIDKGFDTIEKMGAKYCPAEANPLNANWIPGVTSNLNAITSKCPQYSTPNQSCGNITEIARGELSKGVREDGENNVKYGNGQQAPYHITTGSGGAWCARFVWWNLNQAGYKVSINDGANGMYQQLLKNPEWESSSTPKPNCVVYYGGHIGIVESVSNNSTFNAIDGNWSDSVTHRKGVSNRSAVGFVCPKVIKTSKCNSGSSTETTNLAKQILDLNNQGKLILSKNHDSSDQTNKLKSTVYDNIVSLSNSQPANRSIGTDSDGTAPGGSTSVNPNLLKAIIAAANAGYMITVDEITGGIHSVGSTHYQGRALDIDAIDGKKIGSGSKSYNSSNSFISSDKIKNLVMILRQNGATTIYGPSRAGLNNVNGTHESHLHIEF